MSVPPDSVVPPPPPAGEPVPPPEPFDSTGMPSHEERQWALFAHLSALLGGLLTGAFAGLGCFIGPLVIWLVKKDTMPFVDDQAKEALNFNITLAIVGLVLLLLTLVTFGFGALLAVPVGILVGIAWLVLTIIAAVKANEGERYRYPFALRLIK
jgi:uncharacterized Tic20 family protein